MDERRVPVTTRATAAAATGPTHASGPAVAGGGNGTPAGTPASSATASPTGPAAQTPESSVKETLESILVAFILAFIFRAFVVEAFVIPTGSMAPTLLGAHVRYACSDCGYRFETNYNARNSRGDEIAIPSRAGPEPVVEKDRYGNPKVVWRPKVYNALCPNCGFKVPTPAATNPEVHYGDRILVLKYLYLFQDPARWDVVVFKSPDPPPGTTRETYDYSQNYIKRLVGRPNESVLVLDGDVYVAPADANDVRQFTVQTKPGHVQQALWRVIYDNDYHPRGLDRNAGDTWEQPWQVRDGGGWNLDAGANGRVFAFVNPDGAGTLFFNEAANPVNVNSANRALERAFTDWLAYDIEAPYRPSPVSDLRLSFHYQRSSGDGPLRLRLTKLDHEFVAELTATEARLVHVLPDGTERPVGQPVPLDGLLGREPVEVELENVDYQVTLRVGGRTLIRTTSDEYRPDVEALLAAWDDRAAPPPPRVEITAERQTARFTHVGLWRDVYYLNTQTSGTPLPWASPADFPNHVARLGDGEYFVLGDNSLISGDARYWEDPIVLPHDSLDVESGRVPERFMLGKAFFVYWPAGYRPAPFVPALSPNFGEMRFIR